MGCGGSRADTIEPRYYESWTRETESTWLTNTDTEAPLPGITNGCSSLTSEPSALEKGAEHVYSNTLEGGIQTQTHVTASSNVHEKVSTDKKTSTVGTNTQIGKQHLTQGPPTMKQKRRLFRTEEILSLIITKVLNDSETQKDQRSEAKVAEVTLDSEEEKMGFQQDASKRSQYSYHKKYLFG